ncbi:TPR repeat-containing protein [Novosphingobium pentaromativorans US6-1]|uniref:TPR repeat-containing protein n=2 Tax=Novosphingobium pentaromativorans TaxID=205844 RepID=G6EA10_9SPHN|nr:TPR repeat-containing protein [Novosphingobium pentaromativorans US6-1]
MGQSAFSLTLEVRPQDEVDVAYEELAAGKNEEAIAKLQRMGAAQSNDPAALINLGSAYARVGMAQQAMVSYKAAAASPERYDLELADGSWMDSRWAARTAMKGIATGQTLAVR